MPVTRAFTLSHGPCDKWSNSSNRTVWVIDLLPMWQGSATIFSHINVRINVRLILSTFKHVFTIKNRRLKDRYRHTIGVSIWITNCSLTICESPCLTPWIIFSHVTATSVSNVTKWKTLSSPMTVIQQLSLLSLSFYLIFLSIFYWAQYMVHKKYLQ